VTNIQFIFNIKDKWSILNNLLLKNLQKKKQCLVYFENNEDMELLSTNLWRHSKTNFLPHKINEACINEMICLSNDKIDWMDATLINFSHSFINGFNRYIKLIELVTEDEKSRIGARERFKFYNDCGYKLSSYDSNDINF